MMKEFLRRGLKFIGNNPTIISSLLLIIIVVSALFLNSYLTLNRFQENLDKTLRSKAVLAENIISTAAADNFEDLPQYSEQLSSKINAIKKNDPEISEMTVYAYDPQKNSYEPIVSTENLAKLAEQETATSNPVAQNAKKFAVSVDDAFAYLSSTEGSRFWNVVRAVRGADGSVKGLLLLKLSLAENDALVGKTITQAYLLAVGAVIVVLLLILNHIRLFSYEVKAKNLEEIDKMKDDFISMASHELKSPLTAIRGYSDLLNDTLVYAGAQKEMAVQQRKYLENIDISVDRLKTLVEDLLVVSRMQQNKLPVECSALDVTSIVGGIIDEMRIMADQKGLALKNSLPYLPEVSADAERVKQIMVNLLSNAIKYTPSGTIEILAKEDKESVQITVADTGMGISAENMRQLFSKFYRVQNSQTAQISGTGLGLWIAREVAQKMGGNLTVESIEGVGSHFTLKLKKA